MSPQFGWFMAGVWFTIAVVYVGVKWTEWFKQRKERNTPQHPGYWVEICTVDLQRKRYWYDCEEVRDVTHAQLVSDLAKVYNGDALMFQITDSKGVCSYNADMIVSINKGKDS